MTTATYTTDRKPSLQQSAEPASTRRCWWQFSLRALLVLVTVVALIGGFGFTYIRRCHAQRDYVAWLTSHKDVRVTYDQPSSDKKTLKSWIAETYGPDYVWSIKEISSNSSTLKFNVPIELPELEDLTLFYANGFDWSMLEKMPSLRELTLQGFNSSSVSDLACCTEMQKLQILSSSITDISDLKNCQHLERLVLYDCTSLQDLSPIETLTNLKRLVIDGIRTNRGIDLSKCLELRELRISDCAFATLPAFSEKHQLQKLKLSSTPIQDIHAIAELGELAELDLSRSIVRDFAPLISCKKLTILDLDNSAIDQLKVIAKVPNLEQLQISSTKISDLSPLASCAKLLSLDCNHTEIVDVRPLVSCANLQRLNLYQTKVAELEPLQQLPLLQQLIVSSELYQQYGKQKIKEMFPNCTVEVDCIHPFPASVTD